MRFHSGLIGALVIGLWCIAGAIPNAAAQTVWTVGDDAEDDAATIQGGIDLAGNGDTVEVDGGTALSPITYSGTGNRDINFGGLAITVRSTSGASGCIIDVGSTSNGIRGFVFNSGETSTSVLQGFTIQNGRATTAAVNKGGGIKCNQSSPTIRDCDIRDCQADASGGGIHLSNGSSPIIEGCRIFVNESFGKGGGLAMEDDCNPVVRPTVSRSSVIDTNTCYTDGGGVHISANSDPTFEWTLIWANETVVPSLNGNGGGVAVTGSTSNPLFDHCWINGNVADHLGGGIWVDNALVEMVNTSITQNTAGSKGGGARVGTAACLDLRSCTVAANEAGDSAGGGGVHIYGGGQTLLLARNTIFADNFDTGGSNPDQITKASTPDVDLLYCCTEGETWTGTGNIDDDPGLDGTFHDNLSSSSSPCKDAGNNSYVFWDEDIEHSDRIQDTTTDMGSDEYF